MAMAWMDEKGAMPAELMTALLETVGEHALFFCQDREGRFTYISEAGVRLLGSTETGTLGYENILTADPCNFAVWRAFNKVLEGSAPEPFEMEIFACDGKPQRFKVTQRGFKNGDGIVETVYSVAHSITREAMLKEAQRLSKLGFVDVDHDSETVLLSEEACEIYEIDPAAPRSSFEAMMLKIYEADRTKVAEAYLEAVRNRHPFAIEYRLLTRDGGIRYLLAEGESRFDAVGNPLRTLATVQDVTERYALDYQLKEAQRLAKLGSWNHDLLTKRSLWSEEMYRIYEKDQSEREVSYESIVAPIHPEDRSKFKKAFRDAVEYRVPFVMGYRLLLPDGRIKYLQSQAETTYGEGGRPLRIVGTTQDVTERVELQMENERKQQMLFQQSKMAQMGEMLSSIAHQWRQPLAHLNSMILEIDMAYEKGSLDETRLHDVLDRMERVTDYLSQTIEDFRHYSHPNKAKEHFTARELCDDALALFEPMAGHRIGIQTAFTMQCPGGSCEILGYKKELIQVLLVLLNNARDVLNEMETETPWIRVACDLQPERFTITVSDNGGGIAVEPIEQIFEPYFSTKENREGTGMGLYLARMIVENSMNGALRVQNDATGARFTVELPTV